MKTKVSRKETVHQAAVAITAIVARSVTAGERVLEIALGSVVEAMSSPKLIEVSRAARHLVVAATGLGWEVHHYMHHSGLKRELKMADLGAEPTPEEVGALLALQGLISPQQRAAVRQEGRLWRSAGKRLASLAQRFGRDF